MREPAIHHIFIVRGGDPVRLREFVEASGWQMPLAPFVADGPEVAIVGVLAKRSRSRRRGPGGGTRPAL